MVVFKLKPDVMTDASRPLVRVEWECAVLGPNVHVRRTKICRKETFQNGDVFVFWVREGTVGAINGDRLLRGAPAPADAHEARPAAHRAPLDVVISTAEQFLDEREVRLVGRRHLAGRRGHVFPLHWGRRLAGGAGHGCGLV